MKKAKNLTLLIGGICIVLYECWGILKWLPLTNFSQLNFKYAFLSYHLPAILTAIMLVLPILLFVRNLRGKTGKVLPVISIAVNGIMLISSLCFSLTSAIPKYLIMSEIGLIDTYLASIIGFLSGGGWLYYVGLLLIIVGSVLSLFGKNNAKTLPEGE